MSMQTVLPTTGARRLLIAGAITTALKAALRAFCVDASKLHRLCLRRRRSLPPARSRKKGLEGRVVHSSSQRWYFKKRVPVMLSHSSGIMGATISDRHDGEKAIRSYRKMNLSYCVGRADRGYR
jgi:hypothetical protein